LISFALLKNIVLYPAGIDTSLPRPESWTVEVIEYSHKKSVYSSVQNLFIICGFMKPLVYSVVGFVSSIIISK